MATHFNEYNPLTHKKLVQELDELDALIAKIPIVREKLTPDEQDECDRFLVVKERERRKLEGDVLEYDQALKSKETREKIISLAQEL